MRARRFVCAYAGVAAVALGLGAPSHGDDAAALRAFAEGSLYALGSERQTLLFRQTLLASPDGRRRRNVYVDPGGEVVSIQDVWLRDGRLESYVLRHPRAGRSGELRLDGRQLTYSWTRDGRTRTSRDDWTPDFVCGPMLVPWMRAHWRQLLDGETLTIRLGVLHRRTSYRFELAREAPNDSADQDRVRIRMRASNFFLRRIVDPITFTLSRDGAVLHEVSGRTAPLREVDGAWRPAEVEGVYRSLPR